MTTMTAPPPKTETLNLSGYDRFAFDTYTVHRKLFKIFGAAFTIYDAYEGVAFYSKQKAFKLKEDIRLYTDDSLQTEVLSIQARNIIDFGASYDVVDSTTGDKVGALKRKGMKSILKDEWLILDDQDRELGLIKEESVMLALLRRFVNFATIFFPQKYLGEVDGQPVCQFRQNFNPFAPKIALDFRLDPDHMLDRRMGIAAAVLLCAIEGRQQ